MKRSAAGPPVVSTALRARPLAVSRPGDPLEVEADRAAEHAVRSWERWSAVAANEDARPARMQAASPRAEISRKCARCDEEDRVSRKATGAAGALDSGAAVTHVPDVIAGQGAAIPESIRAPFERGLRYDFSRVRVHADPPAAESARALDAHAYTFRDHIVFGAGKYAPGTSEGRRLLAHELAHVVQQGGGSHGGVIQRACLAGSTCAAPPGNPSVFGAETDTREDRARARRRAMSPARQRSTGHTGPARQLERFLDAQAPGLRSNIHGIFVDQDMDADVEAAKWTNCADMTPPITGAVKPCVFVQARLNQEALVFNTNPAAATIGGQTREDWRIAALQTLLHEVQHARYDDIDKVSLRPVPAGVGSCARADVDFDLSELDAIMSEFPAVFDAVPAGAAAGDPASVRLSNWFDHAITNPSESIRGALTGVRCKCSCPDADAFIKETFAHAAAAWTAAQKSAFNAELRRPVWGLTWPL